jgi:hypothetical protein
VRRDGKPLHEPGAVKRKTSAFEAAWEEAALADVVRVVSPQYPLEVTVASS